MVEFKKVSDAIEYFANRYPERIAIDFFKGIQVNYHNIAGVFFESMQFLHNSSIDPKSRITILTEDALSQALLGLAVHEFSTFCPINLELSKDQLKFYFELLKVDYIMLDKLSGKAFEAATEMNLGVIEISIDTSNDSISVDLEVKKHVTSSRVKPLYRSRISLITTTSGTTSIPKIVPRSYEEQITSRYHLIRHYGFDESSKTFLFKKVHTTGYISGIISSLLVGSTVVVLNGFNHNEIVEVIKNKHITWFTATPAILHSFLEYIHKHNLDISPNHLQFVRSSGAPLISQERKILEEAFGVEVVVTYGMTESGGLTTTYQAPKGFKEGSVGVGMATQLKTENGEILLKGPTVFQGYEDSEIENSRYFTDDDWFKTGDAGYIDQDGYVFITGRIKEMINKGGDKVSPYEVEKLIMDTCHVKQAYVFPYPNAIGSEDVGLVIVEYEEHSYGLKRIRGHLDGLMPAFKMPSLLFKVDEIPFSDHGKVQRKLLFDRIMEMSDDKYEKESLDQLSSIEVDDSTLTLIEEHLIGVWKDTLRLQQISLEDNFFELGGDSLSAAVVLSEIENNYHRQIPVTVFFELGTVKSIAAYIETSAAVFQLDYLVPIKISGTQEPLFCVHTADGHAVTYHNIGKYIDEDIPVYALKFDTRKTWDFPLTFEQLSIRYADDIMKRQPDGQYHILGLCYGGVLALNIAQELRKRGKTVKEVIMLDSPNLAAITESSNQSLLKKYLVKWTNSIHQMSHANRKDVPRLFIKKIFSAIELTKQKIKLPIYKCGVRLKNATLIRIGGHEAALSWALQINEQKHYDGRLYYFEATLDKLSNKNRIDYWTGIAKDISVISLDTYHNELEHEPSMRIIAQKISDIRNDRLA